VHSGPSRVVYDQLPGKKDVVSNTSVINFLLYMRKMKMTTHINKKIKWEKVGYRLSGTSVGLCSNIEILYIGPQEVPGDRERCDYFCVTNGQKFKIRFCVQLIRTPFENSLSILISGDLLDFLVGRAGFYITFIEDYRKFLKILKMRLVGQRFVSVCPPDFGSTTSPDFSCSLSREREHQYIGN
jgi:hypothetical protein